MLIIDVVKRYLMDIACFFWKIDTSGNNVKQFINKANNDIILNRY